MNDVTSDWAGLLRMALGALDRVFPNAPPSDAPYWTFGGGTALMLQIDHRISHDIDIFVHQGGLKPLTPARNPGSARISSRFQYPGHYLKFELPTGEIDFLVAGLQTDPGFGWCRLLGRTIALETPEEIIVKKIRYRSESLKLRDAFDIAALAQSRPNLASTLATEVGDALPRAREALRVISTQNWGTLSKSILATPKTEALKPYALEIARNVVEQALDLVNRPDRTPAAVVASDLHAEPGAEAIQTEAVDPIPPGSKGP